MILWAGLFDYLVWDKLPTLNLLIGAGIIIASNLFILWREHKKGVVSHETNPIR
jgi:drug/metabolite transporter (DMT)-like permease